MQDDKMKIWQLNTTFWFDQDQQSTVPTASYRKKANKWTKGNIISITILSAQTWNINESFNSLIWTKTGKHNPSTKTFWYLPRLTSLKLSKNYWGFERKTHRLPIFFFRGRTFAVKLFRVYLVHKVTADAIYIFGFVASLANCLVMMKLLDREMDSKGLNSNFHCFPIGINSSTFFQGLILHTWKPTWYWKITIFNRNNIFKWWHFPASHVRYVSFRESKATLKSKDSRHKRWDDHLQYKELIHPKCCGNLGTTSRQFCQIAGFNLKWKTYPPGN